jgi:hypothetical protein
MADSSYQMQATSPIVNENRVADTIGEAIWQR